MSDIGQTLTQGRIGRFPIWAVGLVLAALVLGFLWWRKRGTKGGASTATAEDPTTYYQDPDTAGLPPGLPPGAIGDWLDANPLDSAYPVGLTPSGIPGPVTNVQWAKLAFDYLIGQGNEPSLVERGLAKYIGGQALSVEEQAVVNLAQRAFGSPPEGLIIVPTTSPPSGGGGGTTTPTPGGTATARPYVIVKRYTKPNPPWESTLSGIAAHTNQSISNLVAWNNIKNPNLIYTGQKIWVGP